MSEENKALVRGFYDDINRGNMNAFLAKLADDFVEHEAFPGVPPTKQGVASSSNNCGRPSRGFAWTSMRSRPTGTW
jgi:hypothetical protein